MTRTVPEPLHVQKPTLDLRSQPGAYYLSATVTTVCLGCYDLSGQAELSVRDYSVGSYMLYHETLYFSFGGLLRYTPYNLVIFMSNARLKSWLFMINNNLTEGTLLIFLQYGAEKLLAWSGIETTTLDHSSNVRCL